ncbi:hypothetical protein [Rhizobacter sp. OV335]|nr:hypothetical protein [Rhizobacter sp. OV335]SHN18785.1 hypothetical protein SAMN02787076_03921 [Rhizobacter sp. OV335]
MSIHQLRPPFATKDDVSDAKYQIVVWVVATFILSQVLPIVLKKFGL